MLFNSKKSSSDGFFYSNQDFIAFSNFRSCLLEVYVQLDSKKQLSDEMRTAIQHFRYWTSITVKASRSSSARCFFL